jgi:hypothetical protein
MRRDGDPSGASSPEAYFPLNQTEDKRNAAIDALEFVKIGDVGW